MKASSHCQQSANAWEGKNDAPLLLERVLELGTLDLNRPLALVLEDALVGPARRPREVVGPAKGVGTGAERPAVRWAVAGSESRHVLDD